MKEFSLVLVKPDAVIDGKSEEIKNFLRSQGMSIVVERRIWFTPEMLVQLYGKAIPEKSFEKMVGLFGRSFSVLLLFEGENAIEVGKATKRLFRERYDYGYYGCTIHACDGIDEYNRESKILLATSRSF